MEQALPLVGVVLSSGLPNQFAEQTAGTALVAPEFVLLAQGMAVLASHSSAKTEAL